MSSSSSSSSYAVRTRAMVVDVSPEGDWIGSGKPDTTTIHPSLFLFCAICFCIGVFLLIIWRVYKMPGKTKPPNVTTTLLDLEAGLEAAVAVAQMTPQQKAAADATAAQQQQQQRQQQGYNSNAASR